jgi:molybdopterin molybdotransferase
LKPKQALEKILKGVKPLGAERLPLGQCLGRELMEDLRSPHDYPLRDVSAMDGFAFRFSGLKHSGLRLVGERAAGDAAGKNISKYCAVRIMTGAPLPPGTDTVVPKEKARLEKGFFFAEAKAERWDNVRRKGEGMKKGKRVSVPTGPLTSRTLGYLATLGIGSLKVRRQPRVSILVTGEELVAPGQTPGPGGVFESNGLMLVSALREVGLSGTAQRIGDRIGLLAQAARQQLADSDVLIVTGGVSVGEHDPTRKALEAAGVNQVFWRVDQKPGGPLYFGRKGNKAVFGLPGNPAAVYFCFQYYVLPYIRKLMNQKTSEPIRVQLQSPFKPLGKKTFFVKAKLTGINGSRKAKVLTGQGSHLLESMALGDGLLEVPPGPKVLSSGTKLNFHPFQEANI